ncbi:apolipoprotein A-II-like [Alligator sinensis]|uniref:Apolipoprotein A-II n=1 Tax=Alligator sinensis TaxID=38654 RepID=A0A3Q0FWD5_ALLSI|nr:apolipoprotein A-II-like [Alligator sinensis]
MKVLAMAMLLLCLSHLEGAVVRREAEAPAPNLLELYTHYIQRLSDVLTKELPEKMKAEEIKTQAKVYLEQANEQFAPIAKQLHNNLVELFTQLVETGKKATEQ